MKLIIINGPNLNLLGTREPEVYGNESFEVYLKSLQTKFPKIEISYYQSNIEGEIIKETIDRHIEIISSSSPIAQ